MRKFRGLWPFYICARQNHALRVDNLFPFAANVVEFPTGDVEEKKQRTTGEIETIAILSSHVDGIIRVHFVLSGYLVKDMLICHGGLGTDTSSHY